ncbi:hypothetical protein SNEBB_004024 [Seison nebaliae]|nr:hypothetical protein SNEBB_004024 [Seison nebaliae]
MGKDLLLANYDDESLKNYGSLVKHLPIVPIHKTGMEMNNICQTDLHDKPQEEEVDGKWVYYSDGVYFESYNDSDESEKEDDQLRSFKKSFNQNTTSFTQFVWYKMANFTINILEAFNWTGGKLASFFNITSSKYELERAYIEEMDDMNREDNETFQK